MVVNYSFILKAHSSNTDIFLHYMKGIYEDKENPLQTEPACAVVSFGALRRGGKRQSDSKVFSHLGDLMKQTHTFTFSSLSSLC